MADIKPVSPPQKPKAELRKTAIGRQAEQPAKTSSFSPGTILLAAEQKRKQVAYAVAMVSLAFCAFLLVWMVSLQGRETQIMVLDRSSTIHIGPLERVNGNSEIFRDLALWATQVAFQRNPHGFDMAEYVPLFFRPNAVKALNENLKDQIPDIQARNLRQYPQISSYQVLNEGVTNGIKSRFIRVDGNIIRAGFYQDLPIAESVPFTLVLAAVPNPNLSDQSKYPYMIEEFRIDLKTRSGGASQ